MPWTVADVDEHKKGLNPSEKKRWVKIANSVYAKCKADGGSDKTCAPKAIRVANSKFSEDNEMPKMEKMKASACRFTDVDCMALAKKEGEAPPTLLMTAYSGKVIKNHWYWGDLAIDTAGMSIPGSVIPVLEDHMTSRKVGFGKFGIEDHAVVAQEAEFVDTPYANEFISNSAKGFPYQASIYAKPTLIERVSEGVTVEVNGYKFKGPGTVWRKSVLKECSVCTFGADENTKSVAMAEDEDMEVAVQLVGSPKPKEENMDLEKLKAEHPDLYAAVVALGKGEAEKAFTDEKAAMAKQITDLTTENQRLSGENKGLEERLKSLEKNEALRTEREIAAQAGTIFAEKLKASGLREELWPKVKKQISHTVFVKDNVLDETAFAAAIDTELKDWVTTIGEPSVLGLSQPKPAGMTTESEEDGIVDRMAKAVAVAGPATKQ